MTSNTKLEKVKRRYRRAVKKAVGKIEKRDSLLYVRVKGSNTKFLKKVAKENGLSVTEVVDNLFDGARGA